MNKEQRALYDKERYLKNQEQRKINALKYYYENQEYKLEYQRYYWCENNEKIKNYQSKRITKPKNNKYGVISRRKKIEKNLKDNQKRVDMFREQLENAKECLTQSI